MPDSVHTRLSGRIKQGWALISNDERVQFLVAGVQKGSTTTLFGYLAEHPQLQMAACKEAHFFDNETSVDWSAPDYSVYHAAFEPWDGRLRGEATPIYTYWPPSLPRIARYNPEMRLIILFRDPVARAWSHWKMEYARGWETMPFAQSIREGSRRLYDDPATPGYHRVYSYVERGFYAEQMRRIYSLFPRANVLPLLSHALNDDPQDVLGQVYRFLAVEDISAQQPARRLNPAKPYAYGSSIELADVRYLRGLYGREMALFETLTGLDTRAWSGDSVAAMAG